MNDEPEVVAIDFIAPDAIPASMQCGVRIAVPDIGMFPHCQLPQGHAAWHRYVQALNGIEGEVELRWS